MSKAMDIKYAMQFIRLITQPWNKTKAYELGIIDADGKLLKRPTSFNEKSAYDTFTRLVFNIKRILQKVPLVGNKLNRMQIASLFLLKEHCGFTDERLTEILRDALGIEIDASGDALLQESAAEEEFVALGIYRASQEIASPNTGEMICRRGDEVMLEGCIASLYGEEIYAALHLDTEQRLYLTRHDVAA